MEWISVSIETTTEGIDNLCAKLYQLGIGGVEIEDASDFTNFLEEYKQYWDYVDEDLMEKKTKESTKVKIYVPDNVHGMDTLNLVKEGLEQLKKLDVGVDFGSLALSFQNIKEEDWANNWKKYFKPFPVGEKIMVKPSWEKEIDAGERVVVSIDPGMLFGTGAHETTKLCMENLEKYVKPGDLVLDLGCGSGILSILSLLLGAGEAVAADIDPNAPQIVYANAKENNLTEENYHVYTGNIITDEALQDKIGYGKYDVVVANIVADVILAIRPQVKGQMKKDGIFIASGIIYERIDEILSEYKEDFDIISVQEKADWAVMVAKLKMQ